MGRDKFFLLLRKNKLLVRKTKRGTYTTDSKHFFYRYPNMVKDFTPLKAHELWVADITYIPSKERFAYLFLITDAYSRKIVGHHVSDDMKVSSAIIALKKDLVQKPADRIVIHHSDRGMQYCSTAYVQLLQDHYAHINGGMVDMVLLWTLNYFWYHRRTNTNRRFIFTATQKDFFICSYDFVRLYD